MQEAASLSEFFSGTVTAMALLSGFSFAAALQIMGGEQVPKRGFHGPAFLLYVATLMFLFTMWGFIRASAMPTPAGLVTETGFTAAFYKAYLLELLLAGLAVIAFLAGVVSSAWSRSPIMGQALLAVIILSLALYTYWFISV